jgi:hypothetical protein
MIASRDQIARVLALSFASWTTMAKYSLSPTQTEIATRRAGECLWALEIDEYDGFVACPPEGDVIDLKPATRSLPGKRR